MDGEERKDEEEPMEEEPMKEEPMAGEPEAMAQELALEAEAMPEAEDSLARQLDDSIEVP